MQAIAWHNNMNRFKDRSRWGVLQRFIIACVLSRDSDDGCVFIIASCFAGWGGIHRCGVSRKHLQSAKAKLSLWHTAEKKQFALADWRHRMKSLGNWAAIGRGVIDYESRPSFANCPSGTPYTSATRLDKARAEHYESQAFLHSHAEC